MLSKCIGGTTCLNDYLVATHSDDLKFSTIVYVTPLHSFGVHRIRFRIEEKTNKHIFFGITNSIEETGRATFYSSSLYGWMVSDMYIAKFKFHCPMTVKDSTTVTKHHQYRILITNKFYWRVVHPIPFIELLLNCKCIHYHR